MNYRALVLLSLLAATPSVGCAPALGDTKQPQAQADWKEGVHYTVFQGIPHAAVAVPAGKVVVTEVFSYGCPACNSFRPIAHKIQASLPAFATLTYVPAAFMAAEDWPMFQRAYCTAESLGIAAKTHDAMFEAVWTSGELAIADQRTNRLKDPMPTIEDAARWYAKHAGVKAEDFVAASKSFDTDRKIREAENFIREFRVSQTPTIVVNNKYITNASMAGGYEQLVALVDWLVAKEKK